MSVPWGRSTARLLVCIQLREHKQPSIVPYAYGTDMSFFTISRHCVPGYYQMSLRDINGPSESTSEVLRALARAKRSRALLETPAGGVDSQEVVVAVR